MWNLTDAVFWANSEFFFAGLDYQATNNHWTTVTEYNDCLAMWFGM